MNSPKAKRHERSCHYDQSDWYQKKNYSLLSDHPQLIIDFWLLCIVEDVKVLKNLNRSCGFYLEEFITCLLCSTNLITQEIILANANCFTLLSQLDGTALTLY